METYKQTDSILRYSGTCHLTKARWIAVYQGQILHLKYKHNTLLLLSLLRSSITQAGKSIEMNQNMAACLLFLAILGVFSVISQNGENCQV